MSLSFGSYVSDYRLVGAKAIVAATAARLAVAGTMSQRIVTYGITDTAREQTHSIRYVGQSAVLDVGPEALAKDNTYLYSIGRDVFYRHTNAVSPVLSVTATISCERPTWLYVLGSYVYAPYTFGGVQSLTLAGGVSAIHYGATQQADFAAIDTANRYLYVINSSQCIGEVIYLETDGSLTLKGVFAAPNCHGVRGAAVDGTELLVTTKDRVVIFSLTDPETPAYDSQIRYPGYQLNDTVVVSANNRYILRDDFGWGDNHGVVIANDVYILHSKLGRISGSFDDTTFVNTPPVVNAGIDQAAAISDTVTVTATASDDAYPIPEALTYTWEQVSGPATVSFTDATAASTTVTGFTLAGAYELEVTVNDGQDSTADSLTITVAPTLASDFSGLSFDNAIKGSVILNNTLYLVGDFTFVSDSSGSYSRGKGCAIDLSTALLTSWDPRITDGGAWDIVIDGSSAYICGSFGQSATTQGIDRRGLAKFNLTNGDIDAAFNIGASGTPQLYKLVVSSGWIYSGGNLTTITSAPNVYLNRFNKTTGAVDTWDSGVNLIISDLCLIGLNLYAIGFFTSVGGNGRGYGASWVESTGVLRAWNPALDNAFCASVIFTAEDANSVFVADYNSGAVVLSQRDLTTGAVSGISVDTSDFAYTLTAGLHLDGTLFLGNSSTSPYVKQFDAAGNPTAWSPVPLGTVNEFCYNDDILVAGGSFSTFLGQARNCLAIIDRAGLTLL